MTTAADQRVLFRGRDVEALTRDELLVALKAAVYLLKQKEQRRDHADDFFDMLRARR